jgi:hypothetical protein
VLEGASGILGKRVAANWAMLWRVDMFRGMTVSGGMKPNGRPVAQLKLMQKKG